MDNETDSSHNSIDEMLTESYPWRKAYADFLWDEEQFNEELEKQFITISGGKFETKYEFYIPEIGLIFLDSDEIPELLVYYKNATPPAAEYYVIYHYVSENYANGSSIEVYSCGCIDIGTVSWKYLPHGDAYYTGYYNYTTGFHDYNVFILDHNGSRQYL